MPSPIAPMPGGARGWARPLSRLLLAGLVGVLAWLPSLSGAQGQGLAPVIIGFDGEYGVKNSTSAQAIERGLTLAIEEVNAAGGVLGGRPLRLMTLDNRSVPARGIENLKMFMGRYDADGVVRPLCDSRRP